MIRYIERDYGEYYISMKLKNIWLGERTAYMIDAENV